MKISEETTYICRGVQLLNKESTAFLVTLCRISEMNNEKDNQRSLKL